MKKIFIPIFLLLTAVLVELSAQSRDCNLSEETFETFDGNRNVVEQRGSEWMLFKPGAPDSKILNDGGSNGNIINIESEYGRGDKVVTPQIIQLVEHVSARKVSYKMEFYNECGIIALSFLSEYVDSKDYTSILDLEFTNEHFKVNGVEHDLCYVSTNDYQPIEIVFDFTKNEVEVICDPNSTNFTVPFLESASDFYGVTYSSNRCGFIDNICISELSMTTSTSDFNLNRIETHPNPFSDIINVSLSNIEQPSELLLMDITGKVVIRQTAETASNYQVDGSLLEAGVYNMVVLQKNAKPLTKRVVKMK